MNMLSTLRARFGNKNTVEMTRQDYDKLQEEWIKRVLPEEFEKLEAIAISVTVDSNSIVKITTDQPPSEAMLKPLINILPKNTLVWFASKDENIEALSEESMNRFGWYRDDFSLNERKHLTSLKEMVDYAIYGLESKRFNKKCVSKRAVMRQLVRIIELELACPKSPAGTP